jgi:hypothetical protein
MCRVWGGSVAVVVMCLQVPSSHGLHTHTPSPPQPPNPPDACSADRTYSRSSTQSCALVSISRNLNPRPVRPRSPPSLMRPAAATRRSTSSGSWRWGGVGGGGGWGPWSYGMLLG